MCFVLISEQTAIISLYNINRSVFVSKTECVYCAVREEYLKIILLIYVIKMLTALHKALRVYHKHIYRVIKKSLCTWWLQYRNLQVVFKVFPASLQTFIDTPNCVLEDRVQYSMVHIPNVFCDGHLQIIICVGIVRIHWVLYCNHQVHRDFLIPPYFC
jgi:hypothetical protein